MSERKTSASYQDAAPVVPGIQQKAPSETKSTARGDARSTPVLYVESLSLDSLLERAELDLEAQFWPSAASYADRALAVDPSCPKAYLYKLLADLQTPGIDQLKFRKRPFDDHPDYQKIMLLGDESLKNELRESNRYICDHLSELYRSELDQVRHDLSYAEVVSDIAGAESLLEHIPAFPASDQLRDECARKKKELFAHTFELAEQRASESKWAEAISLLESVSDDEKSRVRLLEYKKRLETENKYLQGVAYQEQNLFREAAEIFAGLEDYRDSPLRFKKCNRMIRGNKVRAVGTKHTKAAWVNVFLSAFMSLGCMVSAPSHMLVNCLWGIPLIVFSIVMTIIRARYRPARRMWIVMGAVFGLFVVLTAAGLLPFGPAANSIPSLIYLAMAMGLIFI